MKTVKDFNFNQKTALVRVDFNVPLDGDYNITDYTRINAALATIQKILKDGGKALLMSHLGRPKGEVSEKFSLKHLVAALQEKLGTKVHFAPNCVGADTEAQAKNLAFGEVLLLENLRFHNAETKGDRDFAEQLSKLGDVYVNDAFGTAHRAHASTAIVAEFFEEKMAGFVMEAELNNAQKVLSEGEKPFVAIMGGAKISDKILIIEKLLDRVDTLLIGGAMAYTFFKAQGGEVGKSLVEEDKLDLAKSLIQKAEEKGVQLMLPEDSVVADNFANDAKQMPAENMAIPEGYMGLDIGEKAQKKYQESILRARTILWNGPMGVFEMPSFAEGTIGVAKAVVEATENGAFSLIGGGDSAAAVNNLGFGDKVSYVSTGGGALLEYIEGKTLPGVAALNA